VPSWRALGRQYRSEINLSRVTSNDSRLLCPRPMGYQPAMGVVGRGRWGTGRPPNFFDRGDASLTPPLLWTEIRAKVSPLLQRVTY